MASPNMQARPSLRLTSHWQRGERCLIRRVGQAGGGIEKSHVLDAP